MPVIKKDNGGKKEEKEPSAEEQVETKATPEQMVTPTPEPAAPVQV